MLISTNYCQILRKALVRVLLNKNSFETINHWSAKIAMGEYVMTKQSRKSWPKSLSCRATCIVFMHVTPSFVNRFLMLFVCSVHVESSPQLLLSLAGDCSHCCPRLWEFEDTQRSERRRRTVSLCSQEQSGHSLFKTCNCGRGRWVTFEPGSSSVCQPLVHTQLAWINLKYSADDVKTTLEGD